MLVIVVEVEGTMFESRQDPADVCFGATGKKKMNVLLIAIECVQVIEEALKVLVARGFGAFIKGIDDNKDAIRALQKPR